MIWPSAAGVAASSPETVRIKSASFRPISSNASRMTSSGTSSSINSPQPLDASQYHRLPVLVYHILIAPPHYPVPADLFARPKSPRSL